MTRSSKATEKIVAPGIIHIHYLEKGQRVNSEPYIASLQKQKTTLNPSNFYEKCYSILQS